jgi:hypothetical protein
VESLPNKIRILKKERERKKKKKERKRKKQGLKSKRGKPHMKKLHVSKGEKKKKEDEIYKLLGEILSKERKKGYHIFL